MEAYRNLNPEQEKPVADTEGAVLVLAGAGSGKTRVLTSRIAHLVNELDIRPGNILAITFTNKAANEMKERLHSMIPLVGNMWICTIHSMCVRILRSFGDRIGYDSNFSIYSDTERSNMLKKIASELGADEKGLKNIKYHVGNAKMLGLDPPSYAESEDLQCERDAKLITEAYTLYQKRLKESNAMDFDDLLTETLRLLSTDEDAEEYFSDKFRYIHVDEFQDTNEVQFKIIRLLAKKHGNLFCVGDDDQSIYGWRGAKIENILDFEKFYPDAHVYKLEQNYRSTKNILQLANAVIRNNMGRKSKTLWTENEQGERVDLHACNEEAEEALYAAKKISNYVRNGGSYSECAVLMRVNALTRSYEQEFMSDNIPYKVFGGFRFYERKEIKDILAYLRLVSNPFDSEAATRIINVPKRGIGETTVKKLEDYAQREELSIFDALINLDEIGLTAATRNKLQKFTDLIKELIIQSQSMPVDEFVREVIDKTDMRSQYADKTEESVSKLANIDEFINASEEYVKLNPDATLSDYLNQVTLSSDTDDINEDDCVTLATIHAVKGLEFPFVIICGLEDGIFPLSRAQNDDDLMEEERRLMYVAITRARKLLCLSYSKSRFLYGERNRTKESMFLKELAPALGVSSDRSSRYGYESDGYGNFRTGSPYRNGSTQNASSENRSAYGNLFPPASSANERTYGYAAQKQPAPVQNTPSARPASPSARPAQQTENRYAVGMFVHHPKFGDGQITAIEGAPGNLLLVVNFREVGSKKLSARLAPLEIIQ